MDDDLMVALGKVLRRVQDGLVPLERAFGVQPPAGNSPERKLTVVLRERRRK